MQGTDYWRCGWDADLEGGYTGLGGVIELGL